MTMLWLKNFSLNEPEHGPEKLVLGIPNVAESGTPPLKRVGGTLVGGKNQILIASEVHSIA
jgi:hypothetical protein